MGTRVIKHVVRGARQREFLFFTLGRRPCMQHNFTGFCLFILSEAVLQCPAYAAICFPVIIALIKAGRSENVT